MGNELNNINTFARKESGWTFRLGLKHLMNNISRTKLDGLVQSILLEVRNLV